MSAPYIFRFVGDSLANLTNGYSEAASSQLAGAIGTIAITAVTMFIAVYGALVIAGKIQQPFQDFMLKAAKWAIVCAIALNAGNYTAYVADAVNGLESGLVTALRAPGAPAGSSSTYEQLDESIGQANELVRECFDKASEKNMLTEAGALLGWLAAGVIIGAGIVIFFFVGGAIIIATKFLLAIMIGIGPLFVLALLHPATAGFFDRWLGQTLTYVFTVVLVAVVMSLGVSVFDTAIERTKLDENEALFMAMQLLFCGLILAYVTMQIGSLASGIAGGAGAAIMSARQLIGVATAPGKFASDVARSGGNILNPVSNRLDPRTGLQTQSSRLEHVAQGRTIVNPAYRKAVVERAKEAWGGNTVKGK